MSFPRSLSPHALRGERESWLKKLDSGSSELMSKRVHAMTTSRDMRTLIQTILKKLVAEYAPKQVILFGSYAYGTPGPDSDIDLLIIKETPERFIDRWVAVKRILTGTPIRQCHWRLSCSRKTSLEGGWLLATNSSRRSSIKERFCVAVPVFTLAGERLQLQMLVMVGRPLCATFKALAGIFRRLVA